MQTSDSVMYYLAKFNLGWFTGIKDLYGPITAPVINPSHHKIHPKCCKIPGVIPFEFLCLPLHHFPCSQRSRVPLQAH